MSTDIVNMLGQFFKSIWDMLGSIPLPGMLEDSGITLRTLLVAPIGASAFITFIKKITDIGGVSSSTVGHITQKGKTYNSKINAKSEEN